MHYSGADGFTHADDIRDAHVCVLAIIGTRHNIATTQDDLIGCWVQHEVCTQVSHLGNAGERYVSIVQRVERRVRCLRNEVVAKQAALDRFADD